MFSGGKGKKRRGLQGGNVFKQQDKKGGKGINNKKKKGLCQSKSAKAGIASCECNFLSTVPEVEQEALLEQYELECRNVIPA
jgi:hypothetical protein